jgi:hypothetical protein
MGDEGSMYRRDVLRRAGGILPGDYVGRYGNLLLDAAICIHM